MCATDVSSFCDAGVQRVRRAVFNASDIFRMKLEGYFVLPENLVTFVF